MNLYWLMFTLCQGLRLTEIHASLRNDWPLNRPHIYLSVSKLVSMFQSQSPYGKQAWKMCIYLPVSQTNKSLLQQVPRCPHREDYLHHTLPLSPGMKGSLCILYVSMTSSSRHSPLAVKGPTQKSELLDAKVPYLTIW